MVEWFFWIKCPINFLLSVAISEKKCKTSNNVLVTFNFGVNVAPIQAFPLIAFVQLKAFISNCFINLSINVH